MIHSCLSPVPMKGASAMISIRSVRGLSVVLLWVLASLCVADDLQPFQPGELQERAARMEEQKRKYAEAEVESLNSAIEQLKIDVETKAWSLDQFKLEQRGLRETPASMPERVRRQRQVQDNFEARMVDERTKMLPAIESGKSLDYFVSIIGPTADKHVFYHEQVDGLLKELGELDFAQRLKKTQEQLTKQQPDSSPSAIQQQAFEIAQKEQAAADERVLALAAEQLHVDPERLRSFLHPSDETLEGISRDRKIDEKVLKTIRLGLKQAGGGIVMKLGGGPFDLEWPFALKLEEFDVERKAFEDAAKKYEQELKNGNVKPQTMRDLQARLSDLLGRARDRLREEMKAEGGFKGHVRSFFEAKNHLERLVISVSHLENVSLEEQLALPEFKGGTIEDLIAYMYRNNLKFEKPRNDPASIQAYHKLHTMMVGYYTDLATLLLSLEQDQGDLAAKSARRTEVEDVVLGKVPDAFLESLAEEQRAEAAASAAEAFLRLVERGEEE